MSTLTVSSFSGASADGCSGAKANNVQMFLFELGSPFHAMKVSKVSSPFRMLTDFRENLEELSNEKHVLFPQSIFSKTFSSMNAEAADFSLSDG